MKKFKLFIAILAIMSANVAISQWNSNGNNIFNTNTGNVGIGNNSPSNLLHVQKNMTEPMITVQNLGGFGGATYSMIDDASGANWKFKATLSGGFKIRDHANSLDVFVIEPNSAANVLYIKSGGSIGVGTATPSTSAIVEINSSSKGFLLPRMTKSQRDAIQSPQEGLLIFNLTTGCFDYYLGGSWKSFCGATEPSFQCGMKITDSRDGKIYNTVQIGTQCWMAENLNIGTRVNGSENQLNNDIFEKYCYDDDETNCDEFGGMYQWNEAMQYTTQEGSQGICPIGWHVPADQDWCVLTTFIDETVNCGATGFSGTDAGLKMKATTSWISNGNGTNLSGFTALAGGYRDEYGNFEIIGINASFFTSTEYSSTIIFTRGLVNNNDAIARNYGADSKISGQYVRCVMD